MKNKLYPAILFLLFSMQAVFAQTEKADTVKRSHLLVKVEILLPILFFIEKENDGNAVGLALEYKTKTRFSYQLTGYYLWNKNQYFDAKGYILLPEARYYLSNHFVGFYTKFMIDDVINYSIYNRKSRAIIIATGPLYGYQLEFGRFNIEGNIMVGISKTYWPNGRDVGGVPDDSVKMDFLMGIKLGWKIF